MRSLRSGYDVFFAEPGECDEKFCNVCGSRCNVMRDCMGATSFAGAVFGKKRLHDTFTCPYFEAEWHGKVIDLIEEYKKTSSKRLKWLIKADMADEFFLHPNYSQGKVQCLLLKDDEDWNMDLERYKKSRA